MNIIWPYPDHKIKAILYSIVVASTIIILRLVYLQVALHDSFWNKGKKNFLRMERIPCPRGDIIDCNGCYLATNRPTIDLAWQGSGNTTLNAQQLTMLDQLKKIMGDSYVFDEKKMAAIHDAERRYQMVTLATDISFDQLSKIEEQYAGSTSNIFLKRSFKRFYPYRGYASHLLGYLGTFNLMPVGKMGLEQLCEPLLQGEQGIVLKTINSIGRHQGQEEIKRSMSGQTIRVTLDMELQKIIEEVFPESCSGTCIIMDPEDGALRAVLSRPGFDPSLFLEQIHMDTWQQIQQNQPFLNRAFNACYPPGSIFKLVTTAAALEHHLISPDDQWYCKGYVSFAGRNYYCNKRTGHGQLSVRQSVAKSCNAMFFELGKKIDIDILSDYAHRFGLGEPTEIKFPEKTGLVPSRSWKRETKGERWWPGETLSATIGQSFLLVTPIQVARMISSIFTGYLVTPRILAQEPVVKKELRISASTRQFLKKSMKSAIKKGSAQRLRTLKDFQIYAKTSTAQTSSFNKQSLGSMYLEHGWCVVHFQYKDEKPLTMVILIEHSGTSRVSTEVAGKILLEYKNRLSHNHSGPDFVS